MKKIKLIKGCSYMKGKVYIQKGIDKWVEDDVALALMKTGRFQIVDAKSVEGLGQDLVQDSEDLVQDLVQGADEVIQITAADVDKMKKDELIALANERGIDLSDCSNNDERAEKIKGFLGINNFSAIFNEEE